MEQKNIYCGKSARLTDVLLTDLESVFAGREYLPPEHELAERYQASRHTVRRMLENLLDCGAVRRDASRRLLILHSKPRIAASRRTFSVTFAYAAVRDPLIAGYTEGIQEYAKAHDWEFQLITSETGHEAVLSTLAEHRTLGIDGVILMPYNLPEYRTLMEKLIADHLPLVMTGAAQSGIPASTIGVDNFSSIYQASLRLIDRCDGAVYCLGCHDSIDAEERLAAYRQAMLDSGFKEEEMERYLFDFDIVGASDPGVWPLEKKIPHIAERLEERTEIWDSPLVGFICHNDYMAAAVYQVAEARGLRIGQDVLVIGFGNLPLGARLKVPLSTIQTNRRKLGFRLAELLHRQMLGELTTPVHLKMPSEFVERQSG